MSCRQTPDDQCVLSPGDNSEHIFDVCAQLSAGTQAKSHTLGSNIHCASFSTQREAQMKILTHCSVLRRMPISVRCGWTGSFTLVCVEPDSYIKSLVQPTT